MKNFKELIESDKSSEEIVESMLPSNMVRDYERRAEAARRAGGEVEVDERMPYLSVKTPNGEEYFFQGHEASNLLDEVPDNLSPEDYFLTVSQAW